MSVCADPSATANATGENARCRANEAMTCTSTVSLAVLTASSIRINSGTCAEKSRNAGGNSVVPGERFTDDGAFRRQMISPEVSRMVAASHLDHRKHLLKVTVNLHEALNDDVV